jgi:hypothetical protein
MAAAQAPVNESWPLTAPSTTRFPVCRQLHIGTASPANHDYLKSY